MIRIIKFEVASDGISPATLQAAGIQGEDRATELKFTLSDELYSSLVAGGGTLFYRFDIETSTGLTLSLTSNNLEGKDISLPLVRILTRDGGVARVTLIITSVSEDFTTESEIYSHACHIRFDNKIDGTTEEEYKSLTTIEQSAKASAGRAETAAAETAKAAAETKAAQRLLEEGTSFIFNGNGMNAPLIVDDTMDNGSDNHPVTKAAIKEYVDNKIKEVEVEDPITAQDVESEISDESANNHLATIEAIKNYVANAIEEISSIVAIPPFPKGIYINADDSITASPIAGSPYYCLSVTDGATTTELPGRWEKTEGRFLIGSGDGFTLGATGGNKTHTLTVNEMPAHSHEQIVLANPGQGDINARSNYVKDANNLAKYPQSPNNNLAHTESAGGGESFNIMNPYLVVNMWHRVD